ncbi:MAG TPA: polymer-forming cytoskeletal protein [Longimicrobiales bacterium]|nr:polymer-forming cytoskeletal protein [Longimicrobiales bacterium]
MRTSSVVVALLVLAVRGVYAQDNSLAKADLPRGVEYRLRSVIEDPTTKKIEGEGTIADTASTNVVVFKGPLHLTGRVDGELIVVDGNVIFETGSSVTGDVTVVNGEAIGLDNATIDGTVTMYAEGFGLFHRERVYSMDRRTRRVYRDDDHRDWGRSSFSVSSGWNYNRVEGLPIAFGPSIQTSGDNPTRLEARAIWRTEVASPFSTDDWGYALKLEQFLGGRRDMRVGATFHSVIDPIEDWQFSSNEASLGTLVLHSDNRDYFLREGWSVFARYTPRATGLDLSVRYRDESHHSEVARDPWTVFGGDPWRLQPLVAEGTLRSINGAAQIDRRNDDDYPNDGFLIRAEITQGIGGNLAIQAAYNPLSATAMMPSPIPFSAQFTNALIDARVYRRVDKNSTLSFRFVGAGTLGDAAAPPQFQHALGGPGSMPGYDQFAADCGARRLPVVRNDKANQSFYSYYGCDRTAVFSAEYRGGFDFSFGGWNFWDEDDRHESYRKVEAHPNWILFFDAGRGWAQRGTSIVHANDTGNLYDIGAGFLLGDIGIYGAVPLTGDDRGLKIFARLGPRF